MILQLGIEGIGAELFDSLSDYLPAFRVLLNPLLERLLEAAGPFKQDHWLQTSEQLIDQARLNPALRAVFQRREIVGVDFFPLSLSDPFMHDLVDNFLVFDTQFRYFIKNRIDLRRHRHAPMNLLLCSQVSAIFATT
jgi:hypothetical protein